MNATKRYYYPRSVLEQRRFRALGGTAPAFLDASMLSSDHFESPLLSLLVDLTVDGHDVSGPLDEFISCCEALHHMRAALDRITANASAALSEPSSVAGRL